jgi:hypothetical protein
MRRLTPWTVAIAVLAVAVGSAGETGMAAAGGPRFSARVDNEFFPLKPGTKYVYKGLDSGRPARDVVFVAHRVKMIEGAPCVVVRDRLFIRGNLEERTRDWYTQDRRGRVWYFGEATAELDKNGNVTSREGSWQAGRDGAEAGIFMPAHPRVGQSFRQEYYKGHAEDHFKIIAVYRSVAPPGVIDGLLAKEWTPLEPAVVDHKMYTRGIGEVSERTVRGGHDLLELRSVRTGL